MLASFLSEDKGVMLTPNQRAILDTKTKELMVSLVSEPVPLTAEDAPMGNLTFDFVEAPVKTVLKSLEQAYGITISPEDPSLYNCTFTGDLTGEDLDTRLEFICRSIGAAYRIEGTTLYITGKGCP
jgi:type II secretory pathway component GspD/PulD (secretin)